MYIPLTKLLFKTKLNLMEKNFINVFRYSCLLLAMLIMPIVSYSQAIACNDLVQVSLDDMCTGLTPDMLLEGTTPSPANVGDAWSVDIAGLVGVSNDIGDPFVEPGTGSGIDWSALGAGPHKYTLTSNGVDNSNTCWGSVIFESNILPAKPDLPYSTSYTCNPGDGPGVTTVPKTGSIVDDLGGDDVRLDPEWYCHYAVGSNLNTWYTHYGDVVSLKVPTVTCPTAVITIGLNSSFKWGLFDPYGVVWNNDNGHAYLLDPATGTACAPLVDDAFGGGWTNTTITAAELAAHTYADGTIRMVVHADNNDAIGSYAVRLQVDEESCGPMTPADPVLELACGESTADYPDWMTYKEFKAYMAGIACGLDYEILDPSYESCGDICTDKEYHIVKYEILVTRHGQDRADRDGKTRIYIGARSTICM